MRHRRLLFASTAVLAGTALAQVAGSAGATPSDVPGSSPVVDVQILALNDFHGNLQSPGTITLPNPTPPPATVAIPAGGADVLATMIRQERATNPNSVFVSAGDLIGASPLISALFHDEPTIEAMNLMGLDFNAVGNHEFDEGAAEVLRMQNGGCHPIDGCLDGDGFAGADFQFLAANVVQESSGDTLFPPYGIVRMEKGVRVAFIGMTLEGTPTIVTPSGVAGLDFKDEADTVNALVAKLKPQADIIVVLIHEGGAPSAPGYNSCPSISGPIVDIVNRTSDEVDLFITGHTHNGYICNIDGRPVTSSLSFGRLFTDIDIQYSVARREVVGMTIENIPVRRDQGVVPAADIAALVAKYDAISAPLRNRVIGTTTGTISRTVGANGESPLGDLIADSQLAATAPAGFGDAVMAFMNPGGIRADLIPNASGQITYGAAFTVQPFGNSLVTMTLTGAQIDTLLEQQFSGGNAGLVPPRVLQVSNGITYSWSASAPAGSKIDPSTIKLNGVTIDPTASYRVTVNSFLADGGDNFTVLREGTNRLGGAQDLDALEAFLQAHPGYAPTAANRITRLL